MHVILFGSSGMVGQGVLRECLADPEVRRVLSVGRSPLGQQHAKLTELVTNDLYDLTPHTPQLQGFDACFFCVGVSAAGMSEADYARVTYDLTLNAATLLAKLNPQLTFVYVSGAGTDSSEKGRTMWARVKGRTENALLRLPIRGAYMFRPGLIQPLHGIRSKTRLYQTLYSITRPLLPLLKRLFPKSITTTEQVGRAMLAVAKHGAPKHVLEAADINAL